jgi:hypothetical protein
MRSRKNVVARVVLAARSSILPLGHLGPRAFLRKDHAVLAELLEEGRDIAHSLLPREGRTFDPELFRQALRRGKRGEEFPQPGAGRVQDNRCPRLAMVEDGTFPHHGPVDIGRTPVSVSGCVGHDL